MSEENNDVSVDEAEAPVVEEQEETGEENTTQAAAEEELSDQDKNWSEARKTMKSQKETIDNQSALLNALKKEMDDLRGKREKPETKAPTDPFDGRDNDDLLTVADVRKAFKDLNGQWQSAYSELSAKSQYGDMDEVINKYGKTLPDSVKYAVVNSDNPHLAAYEACVNSSAYYKDQLAGETSRAAKKAEKNLKKPGSASSVGNAGTLSKASYYDTVDDAKLLAESEKYIFGR